MTIKNSFHTGFSIKMPNGLIRRFGTCEWSDDPKWKVENGILSNDFGHCEKLPEGTMATFGYHDNEHGEWNPCS